VHDDEILTGEGVILDARPVSFGVRVLGGIVDAAVYLGVLAGLSVALSTVQWRVDEGFARALTVLVVVTVTLVLPTLVETLSRGRSLGKLLTRVRVVRDDGGPVRFRQAFVRALTGVGELWVTGASVAILCSLFHPRGKRVGDVLAGTYAVRVSGAAHVDTALRTPPQLAGWAATADMRRLPDGLALACRQFLRRAERLSPASRVELGSRLAAELSGYVAPPPPPGTPPEHFLVAVLAERRDRELAALERAAELRDAEALLTHRLPHGVPDPEL